MHIGTVRSLLILGVDAIASNDSHSILLEYHTQGVGRLPHPLNVALADVVGDFDGHPDRGAVRFALGAKNDVGGTDAGLLRVGDGTIVKGFFNRIIKLRAGIQYRTMHYPRSAQIKSLTEKRANPPVELHLQDISLKGRDILLQLEDTCLEFSDIGLDALQT